MVASPGGFSSHRGSGLGAKFVLRGIVHPMLEEGGAWAFRFFALKNTKHSAEKSVQDLFRFKMIMARTKQNALSVFPQRCADVSAAPSLPPRKPFSGVYR